MPCDNLNMTSIQPTVASFQNARHVSIDHGVFTNVAGNSTSHSIAGLVMEGRGDSGTSNVHINSFNVGDQYRNLEDRIQQYVCMLLPCSSYTAYAYSVDCRSSIIMACSWILQWLNNLHVIPMPNCFYPGDTDILYGSKILILVLLSSTALLA